MDYSQHVIKSMITILIFNKLFLINVIIIQKQNDNPTSSSSSDSNQAEREEVPLEVREQEQEEKEIHSVEHRGRDDNGGDD